ncbi:MAG: hypothetical protein EPN93_20700 [Spirochaetes bacterium]|nr:MAG: hypothetical protein EPN93_20700 [Spirochaetota bacterium]
MKKSIVFSAFIFLFFIQSCIPFLIIDYNKEKEIQKVIEIAKQSHFDNFPETNYNTVFNKISKGNYRWESSGIENNCSCLVNITYADPKLFYNQTLCLLFSFRYDTQRKEIELEKVVDINNNRLYSEPEGIAYVTMIIMKIYNGNG